MSDLSDQIEVIRLLSRALDACDASELIKRFADATPESTGANWRAARSLRLLADQIVKATEQADKIGNVAPDRITEGERVFIFYREHFPFGQFAGYQSADKRFRFWIPKIGAVTPIQLAEHLKREYEQSSETGIRESMRNYAELRALAE